MSRRIVAIIATVGTLVILFICATDVFAASSGPGGNYHGRSSGRVYVGRGPWVRSWSGNALLCFALRWLPVCLP